MENDFSNHSWKSPSELKVRIPTKGWNKTQTSPALKEKRKAVEAHEFWQLLGPGETLLYLTSQGSTHKNMKTQIFPITLKSTHYFCKMPHSSSAEYRVQRLQEGTNGSHADSLGPTAVLKSFFWIQQLRWLWYPRFHFQKQLMLEMLRVWSASIKRRMSYRKKC